MAQAVPDVAQASPLTTPIEDACRAMSPLQREPFIERVNDALSEPALDVTDRRRHEKAKTRAHDALGLVARSFLTWGV